MLLPLNSPRNSSTLRAFAFLLRMYLSVTFLAVANRTLKFFPLSSQGLAATIKYFSSIDLSDYDDHLKPLIMAIEKK